MFTRADITPLSIAAATAVCAGLGLGAWAGPPAHLHEPSYKGDIQPIYGDDPNLARYKQVIAEQGGPGPLYIVTAYPSTPPPLEVVDDHAAVEAQIARETAEFEAQTKAWEADRAAWLQAFNAQRAQAAVPAAAQVSYAQPEQVTVAPALAEPPPQAPFTPE